LQGFLVQAYFEVLFKLIPEAPKSLHQFSQTSQILISIMWIILYHFFTKFKMKV